MPRCRPAQSRSARTRRGFTLIEVCVAIGVLTIAMVLFSSVMAASARMSSETRESSVAAHAARSTLEMLRGEDFESLWARYNANPDDDPAGPGSAPGPYFAVAGLDLVDGDPDGFVGEIVLPSFEGQLREDALDERFGLPRDLNGDTISDVLDHAGDYAILPVLLRIEWRGKLGTRRLEMYTMLTGLED